MEKCKLHLVSHVHWDQAWYLPFEQYRIRLLELVRKMLEILEEKNYASFMFDGQVSALDDYLELIPEDEERIRKHIKSGRLIIGPWYIQPEEFMISGEAHIRNLLLGCRRGKELGGVMNLCYLPDMVGHIPQMPQIVRGFGMDAFIGWRGIFDGKRVDRTESIWESPDGSNVLLKVMPFSYYAKMPEDEEGFIKKVKEIEESLSPLATTKYLLIMDGGDHLEPSGHLPELIQKYNAHAGWDQLEQVSLQHHIECINDSSYDLKTYSGELRDTTQSFILTGILTTRMHIKLMNENIVCKLEKWMEPFCSINTMLGAKYPDELLAYVWKKQIRNSFHDNIYGAHVDQVTLDMENDYKRAGEVADWVIRETLYNIGGLVNTTGKEVNITVFNPTMWDRKDEVVTYDVFFEGSDIRKEFIILDDDGNYLPTQLVVVEKRKRFGDMSGNIRFENHMGMEGYRYTLHTKLNALPGMGYINLELKKLDITQADQRKHYNAIMHTHTMTSDLHVFSNGFENRYLRVEVKSDGLLDILDRESGVWYRDMHTVEDQGDAGDHYNYACPFNNMVITNKGIVAQVNLLENGVAAVSYKIESDLYLPCSLEQNGSRSPNKIKNHIETRLMLKSNSRVLEFKTVLDNCSKDHRVRLLFPTRLNCTETISGSQFLSYHREFENYKEADCIEKPMGNYPHRLYVDISDGKNGMAVLHRGLTEYYADSEGNMYITLLRCTGCLSKPTFPERSYCDAGPGIETPMAQEIGRNEYEYGLYIHPGDFNKAEVYRVSEEFYAKLAVIQGVAHEGILPTEYKFVDIKGKGIILSALKRSENKCGWIIRVYNVLESDELCEIHLPNHVRKACSVNMKEDMLENMHIADSNGLEFIVKSCQVYTVYFELE